MVSLTHRVLNDNHIQDILRVVRAASKEIVSVYNSCDVKIHLKEDKTPLTAADTASHNIIIEGLGRLFPEVPFISEESHLVPFIQRKTWKYFWLIDPLDGTKEFVRHNGEFTVNVALIHRNVPIFGIVGLPAFGSFYIGCKTRGAFKCTSDGQMSAITAKKSRNKKIVVARSRSHADPREENILSCFKEIDTLQAGSSLKFCYIAEGKADIYLRSGPTMEWDTAAGQCVAESAGATMRDLTGAVFTYNKESLKNSGFVCAANSQLLDMIFRCAH